MDNREILFNKIHAKENAWEEQLNYLQSRATRFDSETRLKIEDQLNRLHIKLQQIKQRTMELKHTSNDMDPDTADKIVHSWVELFTKIDNAMIKLID